MRWPWGEAVMVKIGILDWLVIGGYLVGMLLIGWYSARSTKNTEDYLLGGRASRVWMVGLSLFASLFSTISYMARPGEVIKHGPMLYVGSVLSYPLIFLAVGWLIIPQFMKLRITSANELLEARLGNGVRMLAATVFLLLRLIWMGLIIHITTRIVLGPVLGLPDALLPVVALLLGVITVVYTASGGFKAVILTDVIQTFILFMGALVTLLLVTLRFEGFGWFPREWSPDWDPLVLWFDPEARVTVAGAFVSVLCWYICTSGSDQMAIQRYLSTDSVKSARSTLAISLSSDVLVLVLLILSGFALLGFYTAFPGSLLEGMSMAEDADQFFPLFIVRELPMGLSGLVVAALLAAAMSSLSSGLNSVCAVITVDFLGRSGRQAGESGRQLRRARLVSWITGGAVVAFSLLVGRIEGNLVELIFKTANLLVAPLFVLFFMALFVPWRTAAGTHVGFGCSLATAVGIAYFELFGLSFIWIIPGALIIGMVTGMLASAMLPRKTARVSPSL